MPTDYHSLYRIAVLVHVVAAVVWAGGVLFIGFIAYPAARNLDEDVRTAVMSAIGKRFRAVGWTALAILVGTGLWMAWIWGLRPSNLMDGSFFETARHRTLGYKLLVVVAMLGISGVHDWWIGPRATRLAREDASDEELRPWRIGAAVLGSLTGLLVLVIVFLAIYVARPWMQL